MTEDDLEGSLILEMLSAIGKLDDFLEAVDSDNFGKAAALMKAANVDSESIKMVLDKMAN